MRGRSLIRLLVLLPSANGVVLVLTTRVLGGGAVRCSRGFLLCMPPVLPPAREIKSEVRRGQENSFGKSNDGLSWSSNDGLCAISCTRWFRWSQSRSSLSTLFWSLRKSNQIFPPRPTKRLIARKKMGKKNRKNSHFTQTRYYASVLVCCTAILICNSLARNHRSAADTLFFVHRRATPPPPHLGADTRTLP